MSSLLAGTETHPDDASEFLDTWFARVPKDSLVSVVMMQFNGHRVKSLTYPLEKVKGAIAVSGLDSLIHADSVTYNVYFTVSTLKEVPKRNHRGTIANVRQTPGVWIDFDIKDNAFSSREEIFEFLRDQPYPPTIVVDTGSGGVHAYWRLNKPVAGQDASELALRWWIYQDDLAGPDRSIDRLCDTTRLLRLPGSVRWPKDTEDPSSVRLIGTDSGAEYTAAQLSELTYKTWEEHKAKLQRTRDTVAQRRQEAQAFIANSQDRSDNPWVRLYEMAHIEEMFNEKFTWESILEPHGWTKMATDDDGRVLWSRPFGDGSKSATTDWPDSPNVMSLFSTAPETGLADLHESGVILTKYRVWVELTWSGDEQGAIASLLDY